MIYLAWVDPSDSTWSATFERYDENVFGFELRQREGDFAMLTLQIKNPGKGLLASSRKRWAWLAWDDGSTVTPLFFGRVVGAPEGQAGELLTLTLIARPDDYESVKATLAGTLQALPYFDPVFLRPDAREEPDAVLEARSALWHVDRISHAVTISDILEGEDGTIALAFGALRDSVDLRYTHTPATRVEIDATVSWKQAAQGTVDVSRVIADAARVAGTTYYNVVTTYTGEGLVADWPKAGADVGGGWSVWRSALYRMDGLYVPATTLSSNTPLSSRARFPLWVLAPRMEMGFDVARDRTERVQFSIDAGMQAMADDATGETVISITLSSSAVADAIDGALPIGAAERATYFQTDRGRQSLEHLALQARARLRAEARAVEVSANVPFADAVALTCRHSASLSDARLPGGSVTGKVVEYALRMDGNSGDMLGEVVIGASVGTGGTASATTPVPAYVEEDYADDWDAYSAGNLLVDTADLALGFIDNVLVSDDGIVFGGLGVDQAVIDCTVTNGQTTQAAAIQTPVSSGQAALTALNAVPTQISISMRVLDGLSFAQDFAPVAGELALPKTIDLEAT